MQISEQYIESIHFDKLKNLKDLTLNFSETRLTAIMGVNGAGKSTILHALACCYKPLDGETREDYKFSYFFTPNPYALWNDSKFEITHSYKLKGEFKRNTIPFAKDERWTPHYNRRPERHIEYFGIETCVPAIEQEHTNSFINFATDEALNNSDKIISATGYVLNIAYDNLKYLKSKKGKTYLGVSSEQNGTYVSLSMGAGEQRVFKILNALYSVPKYSLILIDEVDLLLHTNALRRLIKKMYEIANDSKRQLQIVFTTHSILMNELRDYVSIQYITQTSQKTLVSNYISSDSIQNLVGKLEKPLKIYVEDDLSKTIISQICHALNCKRYVDIYTFGPASNSFTLLSGFELDNKLNENIIAVLDGDVYKTDEEKLKQIQDKITGQSFDNERNDVLSHIIQYNLPNNYKPEKWIREMIITTSTEIIPNDNEIKQVLTDIHSVDDDHKYVNDAIERLDYDKAIGLSKIIELASKSEKWDDYVQPIRNWLQQHIESI